MAERVFIGLGSNVGDRMGRLEGAVGALRSLPEVSRVRASPVYETSAVGPRQRDFLNAVIEARTTLLPSELLGVLKRLEKALGRKRRRKWGPREIDLDVLFYGAGAGRAPGLLWPHPRWRERLFVLKPLLDLAPGLKDPVSGRPARAFASALTGSGQSIRLVRRTWPRKK